MSAVVFSVVECWVDETTFLKRGDVYAADDPFVAAHPDYFTADSSEFARRTVPARVVESASQAPGELRRGPGRPRRDGNGPWVDGAA